MAIARGVFIVIISQCQTGIVSSAYAAGAAFAQAGCVLGADMTPEGASVARIPILTIFSCFGEAELCSGLGRPDCYSAKRTSRDEYSWRTDTSRHCQIQPFEFILFAIGR